MGVQTWGGQKGQPLLLKISDAPPFQRQSASDQAQQGSGEAGGQHRQTSPESQNFTATSLNPNIF